MKLPSSETGQVQGQPPDGTITESEADAIENFIKFQTENPADPTTRENEIWDGEFATELVVDDVESQNLEGSASSTTPIKFFVQGHQAFPSPVADRHNYSRAAVEEDTGNWRFTSPPGFYIASHSGLGSAVVSGDKRDLSGSSDGSTPIEIEFAKIVATPSPTNRVGQLAGETGVPVWTWYALAGVVLLAVVAATAFLVGRRRGAQSAPPADVVAPAAPPTRVAPVVVAPSDVMRRLKCPVCNHVFTASRSVKPVCPNCRFGG
jgi:hypothetical protein